MNPLGSVAPHIVEIGSPPVGQILLRQVVRSLRQSSLELVGSRLFRSGGRSALVVLGQRAGAAQGATSSAPAAVGPPLVIVRTSLLVGNDGDFS